MPIDGLERPFDVANALLAISSRSAGLCWVVIDLRAAACQGAGPDPPAVRRGTLVVFVPAAPLRVLRPD